MVGMRVGVRRVRAMLPGERIRQEESLRDAVLGGDAAAWQTLYDGAYAELWTYIAWRCASLRDLAEEVAQETWLVAVRRIGTFDPKRGPFLAWLRGIAAKVVQNQLRKRRRQIATSLNNSELAEPAGEEQERREQAELIAR